MDANCDWTLDHSGRVTWGRAGPAPTALEIWDAEFGDVSETSKPSSSLPNLIFSPAFLRLQVVVKRSEDGAAVAKLQATGDAPHVAFHSWPESDQVTLESRWFPLEIDELRAVQTELKRHEIELDSPLSAEQLMWLYWESGLDIEPPDFSNSDDLKLAKSHYYAPDLVRASLYAYQIDGVGFLSSRVDQGMGAILADEMGLGKTLQVIYILARESAARRGPALVVVPSALLTNWSRELQRFAPLLSVLTHQGSKRSGDPSRLTSHDVVITSYDVLARDIIFLEDIAWNLVVLDEAQYIKNPQASRALAAKRLTRRVSIAVTGTPIENTLRDFWSLAEFVAPHFLGSLRSFEMEFPDEVTAARGLARRMKPLVLRRTVEVVARDLPPRIDIPTAIDTGESFGLLYESVRSSLNDIPLAIISKLRQLCANPASVDPAFPAIQSEFPKYDVTIGILSEAFERHSKVLLFASYLGALDALAKDIQQKYPAVFLRVLDGRITAADRQSAIDEFTAHPGPGLLLMNPRATGVGLNIQAATHVIHYTPEWNPATVAQATARAHRGGQTAPVFVHYLFYASTVEDVMMGRLDSKRTLQDAGVALESDGPTNVQLLDAITRTPRRIKDDA